MSHKLDSAGRQRAITVVLCVCAVKNKSHQLPVLCPAKICVLLTILLKIRYLNSLKANTASLNISEQLTIQNHSISRSWVASKPSGNDTRNDLRLRIPTHSSISPLLYVSPSKPYACCSRACRNRLATSVYLKLAVATQSWTLAVLVSCVPPGLYMPGAHKHRKSQSCDKSGG